MAFWNRISALRQTRGGRPGRRPRRSSQQPLRIELLEDRRLLSAFLDPNGQLTVIGTPANDTIALHQAANPSFTEAVVNGDQFDFLTSSIKAASISGLSGSDLITIGNGNLDFLPVPVTVDGGPGTDHVIVNDQTAPFSDTYTITSTTLSRIIFGGLTYSGIEGLTLNAETGDNTININSTAFGVPVTVNAGLGNDTINVGNGNLDNLPGAVTVNGQGGVDTVNVNDQTAPFSDTYTITSTTLSRIIFGGLSYSGIEGLTLNAETGNNTININSTAFGVPVTVNAGLGNDTINVGNGNLDNLPGAVTVNGQGGVDTVNVNDQTAPFSDTYTITSTTLSRIIFGGLTYSGIEGLTLNAETGNNTININSTAFGVPVTVNAGLGNDTINVGNGNLDNLPGAVTVNGQGGVDTVNVNDQTAPFSDTYTITNTTLSRIIFGGLTYSGIENFVLNAETGFFNVFNIFGTPLTMTMTINMNGGTPIFIGPHGPLFINP